MTLQDIETLVLKNIGGIRYSELSASSVSEEVEDFADLHKMVLLAREEIKLNTMIPGLLKRSSANSITVGTRAYSLPTDFDIPTKVRYRTASDEFILDQVYPDNLQDKLDSGKTTTEGTPSMYMIFGTSSDRIQIELYNIPNTSGEEYDVEYKPTLSNLTTSTDEDILMQKYPSTVIKLATAFAFYSFRKDKTQFDIWYRFGFADFAEINHREAAADENYPSLPDSLIRARRKARFSV